MTKRRRLIKRSLMHITTFVKYFHMDSLIAFICPVFPCLSTSVDSVCYVSVGIVVAA